MSGCSYRLRCAEEDKHELEAQLERCVRGWWGAHVDLRTPPPLRPSLPRPPCNLLYACGGTTPLMHPPLHPSMCDREVGAQSAEGGAGASTGDPDDISVGARTSTPPRSIHCALSPSSSRPRLLHTRSLEVVCCVVAHGWEQKNERRTLNYLVKQYLTSAGYKLSAVTFAEEVTDQVRPCSPQYCAPLGASLPYTHPPTQSPFRGALSIAGP